MGIAKSRLTVLCQDAFWIGLYERQCGGTYEICKVTFGAEPRDREVYEFFLHHWRELSFSPPSTVDPDPDRQISPKRLQRLVRKQTEPVGMGTKAQQALKQWQEQRKTERRDASRARKEEERDRKFALHLERKKQKHRGH